MTERRNHLILVGLIAAALVGVALLLLPSSPIHQKPTLGLDLQGGYEVILKAVPPKGHQLTQADIDTSISTMRDRIDALGVSEPEIRKQSNNQIVIEFPGVKDPRKVRKILGQTAQLELYDLEPNLKGGPAPSIYQLLSAPSVKKQAGGKSEAWYLFDKQKLKVAGPQSTRADLLALDSVKKLGKKLPKGYTVLSVPANRVIITCSRKTAVVCPGPNGQPGQAGPTFYYLFNYAPNGGNDLKRSPNMTGKELNRSGTRQDFDQQNNPVVLMSFKKRGAHIFQEVTKAEFQRGQLRGTPQHFAIVLDRQIRSFPQIDYTDATLSDGISGGAQITGLQSLTEAKDLAVVLQSGALPVNFKTQSETIVSATLGKDSLQQAKKAAIYGLLVVAIFLLLLYRFLGLVAVIGLGIYAAFLYAAILLFNVTLTLPGFAGLILTIGVAADANVVVFERIKEEVRAGKSVRAAISAGYAKGFRTILDANVVTAITALVLFAVATAGVKGFALMLLIGTVISLITAVAATRAMLGLLAGFSWFNNPRFMGAHGQQSARWLQIDFMRRRYLWFAMSGAIVVVGIASLATRGLNLGIDFKGGTQVTFKTPAAHDPSAIRSIAGQIGQADAVIQGRGRTINGGYENFQMRTRALPGGELNTLQSDLRSHVGAESFGINTVSASFGRQIAHDAVLAIIFSLFLVVLYITIRFDLKFAVPVIIAMIHDVVVCVGVYSVSHREVTTSTVAAVLTVLGYSIYDTIIIFDRMRENIPLMRRSSFATIANVSLWETIRRSLATTFITLLPVASLLLFGGATLKDFAFALIVGITSGAYSSIFIAAPLLTIWKEREPEFARRRDQDLDPRRDGEATLEEAEAAAAAEPTPETTPVAAVQRVAADAKRERRRQRRRARPHGRAR